MLKENEITEARLDRLMRTGWIDPRLFASTQTQTQKAIKLFNEYIDGYGLDFDELDDDELRTIAEVQLGE